MEIWKRIPGYEYEASTEGRIKACKTGCILKSHIRKHGKYDTPYLRVGLRKDGKQFHRHIHTLVLEAFVGPRPEGQQCRHLNGDPMDNRLENLTWGTFHENFADKVGHRADIFLTAEDIATILIARHRLENDLAVKIGCAVSTVRKVWAVEVRKRNAPP